MTRLNVALSSPARLTWGAAIAAAIFSFFASLCYRNCVHTNLCELCAAIVQTDITIEPQAAAQIRA